MAGLVIKGMTGLKGMTDTERFRYINFHMQLFKLYENAYYQLIRGRLDNYVWQGLETQLTDYLATSGVNAVWGLRKHQFGQEFAGYMDKLEPTEYALGKTSSESPEN